jgi:hypothetical protein
VFVVELQVNVAVVVPSPTVSVRPLVQVKVVAAEATVVLPTTLAVVLVEDSACRATLSVDFNRLCRPAMPAFAASIVFWAVPMVSITLLSSVARVLRAEAVKKAAGSSRTLLTRRPVASRFCVAAICCEIC